MKNAAVAEMPLQNAMAEAIHIIAQGKGGCGKSFAAVMLAQHLQAKYDNVKCIDTDPVNTTFTHFKGLKTTPLDLLENGQIDQIRFDGLVEQLITDNDHFVIDNGASCFIPLSTYLAENETLASLEVQGRQVYLHVLVGGGPEMKDCLAGFDLLAKMVEGRNIVVWENDFHGPVMIDGKSFQETKAFQKHQDKVFGIVKLSKRNPQTFGVDMNRMLSKKMTFTEAIDSTDFVFASKSRLHTVRKDIFSQLAAIGL